MRILKIIGDIDINLELPKDAEIQTAKLNDYIVTEYKEKFDIILCVQVLQTLWAAQVGQAIEKLVEDLEHMGELHIHVPATEQAAKALLKEEADPVAFYLLWGTEDRPFHTGFTLTWLRAEVMAAGAIVRSANIGLFNLRFNEREVRAPEHVVIATVVRD